MKLILLVCNLLVAAVMLFSLPTAKFMADYYMAIGAAALTIANSIYILLTWRKNA